MNPVDENDQNSSIRSKSDLDDDSQNRNAQVSSEDVNSVIEPLSTKEKALS